MANLVNNPGAETGTMSGWSNAPTPPWSDSGYTNTGWISTRGMPHTGAYSFFTRSGVASISQNISLTIGAKYSASIWVLCNGSCNLALSINDINIISPISPGYSYTKFSSSFTADKSIGNLAVTVQTTASYIYIDVDDISVDFISSPPPSSIPTTAPTKSPTYFPSTVPTSPTVSPSLAPSSIPSSALPTKSPTLQPTNSPTLETGLIAYFPFNGNANDDSGYGHVTTINGAVLTTDRFGNVNNAYKFTTGNDITISDSTLLDIGNLGYSITLWAKIDNFCNTHMRMFSHGGRTSGSGNTPGYYIRLTSQILRSEIVCSSTSQYFSGATTLTLNTWYFFALTATRNGNMVLYLNGVPDATMSGTSSCDISNSEPATVAHGYGASSTEYFCGSLDEIRVYNRALASSEVQRIYSYGSPTANPTAQPTGQPTDQPISQPTALPSEEPTGQPTVQPIGQPTGQPTDQPISQPTALPSDEPTCQPTGQPTEHPTGQPSGQPTVQPTPSPTHVPTKSPTMPPQSFANIDLNKLNNHQGFAVSGIANGDGTGYAVSGVGDINGDGYDDIIVSSFLSTYNERTSSGITYLLFGSSNKFTNIELSKLSSSQGFKIFGGAAGDQSGYSLSGIGDINKDGFDDIIIGAPYAASEAGVSYVIYGKTSNLLGDIDLFSITNTKGFKIIGVSSFDHSGNSVSNAGDINRDGYNDFIIGACLADYNGRVDAGISYVLFGQPSFSVINLATLTIQKGVSIFGASAGDNSGYSVSAAGDINGDGYDDIVIGASQASHSGKSYAGISYIIYGKKSSFSNIDLLNLNSLQGFKILGASSNDYSGCSVSELGDINGDGYDDIVIGAYGTYAAGRVNSGTSYVIYGKPTSFTDIDLSNLPISQGFKIIGANSNDYSGSSVKKAGDINGDGYADIIIGSYLNDANSNQNSGASYVIFGKPGILSDIDLSSLAITEGFKISGANANDWSGYSVGGAGDFNKDGYDDIIIGSYSQSNIGMAYLIYDSLGTDSPSTTPTNSPSEIPTFSPTTRPTSFPTLIPIFFSTASPSAIPTSIAPTTSPTEQYTTMTCSVSQCIGTSANENFVISASSNVIIESGGGNDKFTIQNPYPGRSITINGFIDRDIINLLSYTNVYSLGDLHIIQSNSNVQITLPNSEKIILSDYLQALNAENFEFASNGKPSSKVKTSDGAINPILMKAILGGGISLLTTASLWIFRETIAFSIIDKWGYSYKLIYDQNSEFANLKLNEVGFLLIGNELYYKHNNKCAKVSIDDGINKGIPKGLLKDIIKELTSHSREGEFIFYPSELKYIREFFLARHKLSDNYITDLGIIRGGLYNLCLNKYKKDYDEKHENEIRLSIDKVYEDYSDSKKEKQDIELSNHGTSKSTEIPQLKYSKVPTSNDDGDLYVPEKQISGLSQVIVDIEEERGSVLLSIDAMMDPEHVRRQGEEFKNFGKDLSHAAKEILFIKQEWASTQNNQAVIFYRESITSDNFQFTLSDNLMISLLSVRHILEYLPLIKHMTQGTVTYLGYNVTLPELLDNKALLITMHLSLGNAGALMLPTESITSGMIVSTIDSGGYAMKLMAIDYLKAQKPVDGSAELAKICGVTMLAYTLPSIATCAMTKLALPDSTCALTGYDVMASGSLGAIQCYSNYKATVQYAEPTTAHVVVPYIVDSMMLFILSRNLHLDASSPAMLMLSIKNTMSVAATVYAVDRMTRMVMNEIPNSFKEAYVDLGFNYLHESVSNGIDNLKQVSGDVIDYFRQDGEL